MVVTEQAGPVINQSMRIALVQAALPRLLTSTDFTRQESPGSRVVVSRAPEWQNGIGDNTEQLAVTATNQGPHSVSYDVSFSGDIDSVVTLPNWRMVLRYVGDQAVEFQHEHEPELQQAGLVLNRVPDCLTTGQRYGLQTSFEPLDLPFELINNDAVDRFKSWALTTSSNVLFHIIYHPDQTIGCDEKELMMSSHPDLYQGYQDVAIAQGSLITNETAGVRSYILVIHPASERLDTKGIVKSLGLSKKRGASFVAPEQVQTLTGLPIGAVSPFIADDHGVTHLVFHPALQEADAQKSDLLFDFAFTPDRSVLARASDMRSFIEQDYVLSHLLPT